MVSGCLKGVILNQIDVLQDIQRQIDAQADVLVWQQTASSFRSKTAKIILVCLFVLLLLMFWINTVYALLYLIVVLIPMTYFLYAARSPRVFWQFDKQSNQLTLLKTHQIIRQFAGEDLALSVRTKNGHEQGARWILVSPKIGDVETLLVTDYFGFAYGQNFDLFIKLPTD